MKKKFLNLATTFLLTAGCLLSTVAHAQHTNLLDFTGVNGKYPEGDLVSDGTFLYGMTKYGGTGSCTLGCGVIFKIKPDGTGYLVVLDFDGTNGGNPIGSLVFDGTFLYGMTQYGGTNSKGNIFKIKTDGTGYANLLDFTGTNGSFPLGALIFDGTFLYGMTQNGGANSYGTVFKIMPNGTGYADLLDFNGTNGSNPLGSLMFDGTSLYGMTQNGGANSYGTVFKIMPDGTGYTKLLDFDLFTNGANPYGSLISDNTFLYGMTLQGGANFQGSIFKIMPNGTGYANLLDFNGTNGSYPRGSLVSDGTFLYGMTYNGGSSSAGNLFKIMPNGTGYANLLNFSGTNGSSPQGSLFYDGGFLYGTTEGGGLSSNGTIFKYQVSATSIVENNAEPGLTIYPNPFSSQTTITFTQEQKNTTIKIMDVLGKEVKTVILSGSKNLTIEKGELKEGIYFVSITDANNNMVNRKIVVQ